MTTDKVNWGNAAAPYFLATTLKNLIELAELRASRTFLSLYVWEIHGSVWEIFPKFICILYRV